MNTPLWTAAAIVGLLALPSRAQQNGEAWTPPTSDELGAANRELRAKSPDRYVSTRGDFNGDGQQDRAAIVVRRARGEAAVVVYLSGSGQEPVVIRTFPFTSIGQVGIITIAPGSYQPACARGGGADCDPATRVNIPRDGISLFTFESSATYYWLEGDEVRSIAAGV